MAWHLYKCVIKAQSQTNKYYTIKFCLPQINLLMKYLAFFNQMTKNLTTSIILPYNFHLMLG